MNIFMNENRFGIWLRILALLNLMVAASFLFFPLNLLHIIGISSIVPSFFVQIVGGVSLAFAVGLWIASFEPARHWVVLFVGLLLNIFVFALSVKALISSEMEMRGFLGIVSFLFITTIVFIYVLTDCFSQNTQEESAPKRFNDLLKFVRANDGHSLLELSEQKDLLLIFVRHFGCTFCRETVSEIAKLESAIKGKNLTPVFVHMSDPARADEFFSRYYEHPILHVSDPSRVLYKSLGLKRGTLKQLFGPKIVIRGFIAGFFKGHGLGAIEGDILQLGGYFVLSKGRIVFEHKTRGAADFFKLDLLPQK